MIEAYDTGKAALSGEGERKEERQAKAPGQAASGDSFSCSLGQAIQGRRAALDISQTELSRIAGLDRSYVSDVERGRRNISLMNVCRLAAALKMRAWELVATAEANLAGADGDKA